MKKNKYYYANKNGKIFVLSVTKHKKVYLNVIQVQWNELKYLLTTFLELRLIGAGYLQVTTFF